MRFHGFTQSLQTDEGLMPSIRQLLLQFTSFLIYHSSASSSITHTTDKASLNIMRHMLRQKIYLYFVSGSVVKVFVIKAVISYYHILVDSLSSYATL
jgi:hypothetical protein